MKTDHCRQVLIVEDDFLIAMMMEDIVEDCGFEVVAITPDCATAASHRGDVGIAFVDVNLADGCTGPKIGALLASCGVSIVFVTANPEQIKDGVPGALGVSSKPVFERGGLALLNYAEQHCLGETITPPNAVRGFAKPDASPLRSKTVGSLSVGRIVELTKHPIAVTGVAPYGSGL